MAAKFYIYRNLHVKGHFSIRYKGKVVDHCKSMYANNVQFKVNEKGHQKAIKEKVRNVHAFAIADHRPRMAEWKKNSGMGWWRKITYHPFDNEGFIWADTGNPVDAVVKDVWFIDGEVYGR